MLIVAYLPKLSQFGTCSSDSVQSCRTWCVWTVPCWVAGDKNYFCTHSQTERQAEMKSHHTLLNSTKGHKLHLTLACSPSKAVMPWGRQCATTERSYKCHKHMSKAGQTLCDLGNANSHSTSRTHAHDLCAHIVRFDGQLQLHCSCYTQRQVLTWLHRTRNQTCLIQKCAIFGNQAEFV